jgi:hypothetical protein
MKLKFWENKESIYDEPIDTVLQEMKTYGPDTPEFATQLTYLERLSAMKSTTASKIMKISPDTLVTAGAGLLGIVIIVAYEQAHPMVSKARDHVNLKTS